MNLIDFLISQFFSFGIHWSQTWKKWWVSCFLLQCIFVAVHRWCHWVCSFGFGVPSFDVWIQARIFWNWEVNCFGVGFAGHWAEIWGATDWMDVDPIRSNRSVNWENVENSTRWTLSVLFWFRFSFGVFFFFQIPFQFGKCLNVFLNGLQFARDWEFFVFNLAIFFLFNNRFWGHWIWLIQSLIHVTIFWNNSISFGFMNSCCGQTHG